MDKKINIVWHVHFYISLNICPTYFYSLFIYDLMTALLALMDLTKLDLIKLQSLCKVADWSVSEQVLKPCLNITVFENWLKLEISHHVQYLQIFTAMYRVTTNVTANNESSGWAISNKKSARITAKEHFFRL